MIGIFVPGTVFLIVMGGLGAQGFYDFGDLMFFAICGSILGDASSYEIGRRGRLHLERYPSIQKYFIRGKEFFDLHKGKSVVMGRFIGPIRPIIPFVAGAMDMKRGQFYIYNVLSAVGWSFAYLLLGYSFGFAWRKALMWSSRAVTVAVLVIALTMVAGWFWRWYRSRERFIKS
jgi:undecaprenyl-diphosphatase